MAEEVVGQMKANRKKKEEEDEGQHFTGRKRDD
ncbi:uncharacterized protein G2W53_009728 [Senna tora]|uniref:Uncharacterized protein n=1 Tax=Senna tora TaxID=362788 RepID=A0A835C8P8_9FABA|nr:uncharacterized protein G2W53_009728 [Senna tora]